MMNYNSKLIKIIVLTITKIPILYKPVPHETLSLKSILKTSSRLTNL